jgi:hypothetical protein
MCWTDGDMDLVRITLKIYLTKGSMANNVHSIGFSIDESKFLPPSEKQTAFSPLIPSPVVDTKPDPACAS